MGPTTSQWQIPIGLQLVPGGLLGLGMLLTKESTRWLAKVGKTDEALKSLIWVRGGDTAEVQEEYVDNASPPSSSPADRHMSPTVNADLPRFSRVSAKRS